jgi:DNA-binding NarL/FixJ family response regulator
MSMKNNAEPIRVFLIDDHRSILWGLERLVNSGQPKMQVVGSATSCAEAFSLLDSTKPDVILLDIDLGAEDGIVQLPALTARSHAKILILTGVRDKAVHDSAVLAGASGVVEKETSAEIILTAIQKVHEGEIWLDRAATGRAFLALSRESAEQKSNPDQANIATLTDREREVVAVTALNAGANAKTLADLLFISEHTLRNHLTSIYDKLGVANRMELFVYSHKHGLTNKK